MFKKMLICMTALALIAGVAMKAEAATSADITVTVTLQHIDVSVSPDTWDMGTVLTSSVTPKAFTASNGGNVSEDLTISVGNSTSGDWDAGGTAAENVFVMKEGTTVLSGIPATLATVAAGGSTPVNLEFTAPSPGSVYTEQTIAVTISASATP